MSISASQVAVTSTSTPVTVVSNVSSNQAQVSIRNTGTVTVLLGATGAVLFPLAANEFLGIQLGSDDTLVSVLQSGSTAGQLTVLLAG